MNLHLHIWFAHLSHSICTMMSLHTFHCWPPLQMPPGIFFCLPPSASETGFSNLALGLLLSRHFLFKHGSGSSAIFSAASQNYPLTSNTVYSPPPRPLPRTTFSRPAFAFNKPYRCCNWKCTALSATAITVTLALLLAYVIGKSCLAILHLSFPLLLLRFWRKN